MTKLFKVSAATIILISSSGTAAAFDGTTTTTATAREAMERQSQTETTNKTQADMLADQEKNDDFKPAPAASTDTTTASEPKSDPEADRRDSTPVRPD